MISTAALSIAAEGSENEDAFAVLTHPGDDCYTLCAVADGQGGRDGAAAAARSACDICMRMAVECAPVELGRASCWEHIMRATDAGLAGQPEAGFTTLVALSVTQDRLYGASNGDSAALLINNRLSPAPSPEILTAAQPKNPPVGSGQARFGYFSAELVAPWTLMVMSDGVWKYTGWDPIVRIASGHTNGADIIEYLRDYAALPGGKRMQDDFTLVVIQCAGAGGDCGRR